MSADVERALLVLWDRYLRQQWTTANPDDPLQEARFDATVPHEARRIAFEHFGSDAQAAELREFPVSDALAALAGAVGSGRGPDVTAAVQGLVLGSGLQSLDEDSVDRGSLESLADALVAVTGASGSSAGEQLASAALGLQNGRFTDDEIREPLAAAFGDHLTVEPSLLDDDTTTLSGPAAEVAAQLIDISSVQQQVGCEVWYRPDLEVTSVFLETCTALPFDTCCQRISPLRWPDCNPYFASVTREGQCTDTSAPIGWFGAVLEEVGPGLNLSYYKTDLGVRYVEDGRTAATAFKIARAGNGTGGGGGDGRVKWDSGFLAVVDEGAHRRIQMRKDYRIVDLDVPLDWLCPLWASQLVISGWACSCADSLRRALRAWSTVTTKVLTVGTRVCHACHPEIKHPKKSRVGPLGATVISVPNSYDCPRSDAGDGTVRVPLPPGKLLKAGAGEAHRLEPESASMIAHAVTVQQDATALATGGAPSAEVRLADGAPPGLYVGRVGDTTNGIDVPYTIYKSDLPEP
jgi:hypothetical protein